MAAAAGVSVVSSAARVVVVSGGEWFTAGSFYFIYMFLSVFSLVNTVSTRQAAIIPT